MQYTTEDIESHYPLVWSIVGKMSKLMDRGALEKEDLFNSGVLGLIHALDRFDESKENAFSTYAYHCIRGYMLQAHRTAHLEVWRAKEAGRAVPFFVSLTRKPFDLEEEIPGLGDSGKSVEDTINHVELDSLWETLSSVLTVRQMEMINLTRKGAYKEDIPGILGVSKQNVHQTMNRAIAKIKQHLQLEEEV